MVEKKTYRLIIPMSVLATSACVNISTRVHESGFKIYPISNDTGSIRSAAFWSGRNGAMGVDRLEHISSCRL